MFFDSEIGIELQFFGIWHILQIIITLLVVFLIYHYRTQLRDSKHEQLIRYISAGVLIILEASIHIWTLANNEWSWQHNLPLHLCTINIYLSIVLFITKSRKLFGIIYFWGFGAVLSVLFPDMAYGPDRYRYYQFFYAHMMFLWMYMYMIFVHDYRPNLTDLKNSCIVLFILAIGFVLPINLLLGENYMFLMNDGGTPLSLIYGYGQVLYTIGVIFVIFLIILIWYSPIYYYLKKTKKI